jgi:hypothetical protein
MKKFSTILFVTVLLFTFLEISPNILPGDPHTAQAAPLGPNAVLGFIKTLEALNRRNQIYREAGVTAKEIKDYYDALIEKTQTTRREVMGQVANGEIEPRFAASYVRIEAALEAERKIAIEMVEAEKKGARGDFHRTLRKQVFDILIASPGAQKMLKDIRETIDGLRQATNTIKDALAANEPTEFLANQLTDRLGKTRWSKKVIHVLGSAVAEEFDERMGGILTKLGQPSKLVQAELEEALQKIDELDHHIAKFQNQESEPISLRESWGDLSNFNPLDASQAGADAVATAYTNKASQMGLFEGTDADLESMRDWIRGTLLGARLDYLQIDVKSQTKFVSCISADRIKYVDAMKELGLEPEEPLDQTQAGYLVCYEILSDEEVETLHEGTEVPIRYTYAALIGISKEQKAAQEGETEAQPEDTEVAVTIEEGGPPKGDADSCDALDYVSFELIEGPIEESKDDGSYSCYLDYSITNTHSDSSIVVSWKHDISSSDRGPYWTHPQLGPGESYYVPLTLSSHMTAKGDWRTVDANYLIAWYATTECDYYKNDYWPTEEEPDKLLEAGFSVQEIDNPCRR